MLDNETQRRSLSFAPTLSEDGQYISGRAAVYYDPKDPGTEYVYRMANPMNAKGDTVEVHERIFPGAFTEAIAKDDVVCAYNHEHNIGRRTAGDASSTMELTDTAAGLEYRTKLPNHVWGQMVKEAVARRDVKGSSFLFKPRPEGVTWRPEGTYLVRELRSLFLFDASPVDQPAYKGTTVELRSEELGEVRSLLSQGSPPEPPPPPAVDRRDHERLEACVSLLGAESRSDAVSFDDITQQLYRLLRKSTGQDYPWPTVYETFCIYEIGSPSVKYKQSYTVDADGTASLVGDPIKVKKIETYEPITASSGS